MALTLTTTAFSPGKPIPARHTCDGADFSPALAWDGVPPGTQAFALIVDDPDAPIGVFTHWMLFNLPGSARNLPENVPKTERIPQGALQERNDFGKIGYNGPCPPRGKPHRYHFTLDALHAPVNLRPGASTQELRTAMKGHVLAQAQLVGTYQR